MNSLLWLWLQMKYSHFSWTKFWQIFIVISIQTVSYLALWSDNHQWNNNKNKQPTQYLNKLKNWKENLKGGKEGRRGGPDLHLLHILKKIFLCWHSPLGLGWIVPGPWSLQVPDGLVPSGFVLVSWLVTWGFACSALVMTLRELNTWSGVLVILTMGESHEGEE